MLPQDGSAEGDRAFPALPPSAFAASPCSACALVLQGELCKTKERGSLFLPLTGGSFTV